jgi:adenosylhomocysteine nucleosidase
MIALLGALKEEVSDLRRQMGLEKVHAEPARHLYRGEHRGRDAVLVQTGMGRERAETATKLVLERYPVTVLVSLGFAGALTEDLKVGDVVVCSTLFCAEGRGQGATKPISYCSDDGLLRHATEALEGTAVRFCLGSGVTVPQVISTPEERRELRKAFDAHVVDMESYWIARIASDKRIPFVEIRSISDTPRDSLPPLGQMLTENGRMRWKEALSYFLRHPGLPIVLLGLAWNARRASRSLTIAVLSFVTRLGDTGER